MIAKILFLLRRALDTGRIETNLVAIDGTCLIVETPALENISPTLDPIGLMPRRAHRLSLPSRCNKAKPQIAVRQEITACGRRPKIFIRIGSKLAKIGEVAGVLFAVFQVGHDDIQVASI
jgi:hypothetical protein